MTLNEKIELLKKIKKNLWNLSRHLRNDNKELADECLTESIAYSTIIDILTDDEYAKNIATIYAGE